MTVPIPKPAEAAKSTMSFALRPATEADLDDITRIHVEGFTEEPQVHYCFPLRNEYPEDYWKWTRKEYENYLKQPNKYTVHVLVATIETQNSTLAEPAGVSVWNLTVLTKAKDPDTGLYERRDANLKHCEAFITVAGKRFTSTWFSQYAEKQVNLSALVVHPRFRRHGGGTSLVNWGMKLAEEKKWPTTLCASPMGRLLYEYLGFHKVAAEIVQCEGEEEQLESTAMVLPWEDVSTAAAPVLPLWQSLLRRLVGSQGS